MLLLFGVLVGCDTESPREPSTAGSGSGGSAQGSGGVSGAAAIAAGTANASAGSSGGAGAAAAAGSSSGGPANGGNGAAGGSAGSGHASDNFGGAGGTMSGGASGSASAGAAGRAIAGAGGAAGTDAYRPCPTDGSACKIMPFGDSITDGFGTEGAYRVELFRLAHQAGKNITFVGTQSNGPAKVDGVDFPPKHEGHSGFTIYPTPTRSGISPFVDSSIPQFNPHIVTLMIGTNDAIDDYQMASAPMRLGMLLDSIFVKLPNALIVVAQPIPSQDDALNTRLQTYNASIPAIVKARTDTGKHLVVVDLYTPIAAVADYKTSLLKDTWHPNVAGHVILGAHWYNALAPSL